MDKEVAVLQRKLEAELKNFKDSQKGKCSLPPNNTHCAPRTGINFASLLAPFIEFSKLVQTQRQLDGQYLENKSILEELQLLKPTNTVSIERWGFTGQF